MKKAVLEFALLAAGAAGVAFDEFGRWLSPWGWQRESLSPLLLSMRDEGLARLEVGPNGEILRVRLTVEGERAFSADAKRRSASRAGALRILSPGAPIPAPRAASVSPALQES